MEESVHLLPHVQRLLRRLEACEAPIVQVWGWPGTGKTALLRAFLEKQGRRALGLPLGDFAGEERMREALEAAHAAGARWLVASGRPGERLADAARWLRPGQQLVFAAEARWSASPLSSAVLSPQDLLLSPEETATLSYLITGGEADVAATHALWQASDGWYTPLRLAIDATGGMGLTWLGAAGAEQLLEIPPVRFFLRHQVLDGFSPEERERLLALPFERPAPGKAGEGWELIEDRGLWIDGAEGDRLPNLLAALLERERRRRSPKAAPAGWRAAEAPVAGPEARKVYRLGLLGSPIARQREQGTERELGCRLRRSFQVLAYLASSPGLQAGREELIEAVWPNEGEQTIERNFHPTLSHLRRALEGDRRGDAPPPLLFKSGVYRLNPEIGWEVDVLEFTDRVEAGREFAGRGDLEAAVEAWRSAWRLYRGPFLPGHYEAWVAARREAYQRLYLEMLRDLGYLYVRIDRTEEAMDAFRSVLLEDPLQEKVHLEVMKLYARQGRRDLVRRQYDRLCTVLLEELGVEPLPRTTREYHGLMGEGDRR